MLKSSQAFFHWPSKPPHSDLDQIQGPPLSKGTHPTPVHNARLCPLSLNKRCSRPSPPHTWGPLQSPGPSPNLTPPALLPQTTPLLSFLALFPISFFNIYLFIYWLCRVLVAACGIFRCGARAQLPRGMWDLPTLCRDQTRVPCIGRRILNHWTTREIPLHF